MTCSKCKDTGFYNSTPIGTAHWSPCPLCCKHDNGYWLLTEHYQGFRLGKETWSCNLCGETKENP